MTLTKQTGGLDELAAGSLPTLGGDPLQPSWSRSLQELVAANQTLIGTSTAAPQPTAAAQVLLGSSRTDFGNLAASLEVPKDKQPATFASVEASSRSHRDAIIERILEKEREQTRDTLEKAIERQLEEDWDKERQWWMKELVGTRNLVDTSSALALSHTQTLPQPAPHSLLPDSSSSSVLDPKLLRDHFEVVKPMKESSDLVQVANQFERVAFSSGNGGYVTAWKLLASMLPEYSSSPIGGALGALIHFCKQYQTLVKNRVSTATSQGQDTSVTHQYKAGISASVAAFVKLEHGSNASIWHILYFCLRCGDAVAARDVLDSTTTSQEAFPEHSYLRNVVGQMSQRQGNATCVWERGNPMISSADIAPIADLYDKTRSLEPDHSHKIGVLALLCGKELATFSTIEDYLFGRLWAALQRENPLRQIELIGESIRKYGPEHFGGADEYGGWGYALPLLASLQFRTALTYLVEVGGPSGLLQATHLGLAIALKGMSVEDLGRTSSTGCLVTALLVKYASLLESNPAAGAGAALEYLLRIPKKETSQKEIAALLFRSPQYLDQLAGILNDDGVRQDGELDRHLNKHEVSMVLTEAAELFRQQLHDRPKAEMSAKLFLLSGKYSALLTLLNELISPTDKDDDNKRYWWDQSQRFYSTYLSKRTLVLGSLERENNMRLVGTSRSLMDLRQFFVALKSDRLQEGLEMVTQLGLVPFTQEEINEKESRYKDLEPILQQQFPALLSGVVRCLYGLHRKLKSESTGVDQSVNFHLKDLQKKARFVYIYSGLTGMPSSTRDDIQRFRNHMI